MTRNDMVRAFMGLPPTSQHQGGNMPTESGGKESIGDRPKIEPFVSWPFREEASLNLTARPEVVGERGTQVYCRSEGATISAAVALVLHYRETDQYREGNPHCPPCGNKCWN